MARGARLADWRHCSVKGKRRKLGSRLDPDNTIQGHNFLTPEIVKLAFHESVYRCIGRSKLNYVAAIDGIYFEHSFGRGNVNFSDDKTGF